MRYVFRKLFVWDINRELCTTKETCHSFPAAGVGPQHGPTHGPTLHLGQHLPGPAALLPPGQVMPAARAALADASRGAPRGAPGAPPGAGAAGGARGAGMRGAPGPVQPRGPDVES